MAGDHGCFCTFFIGYMAALVLGNAFLLSSFIENLREIPLRLSLMTLNWDEKLSECSKTDWMSGHTDESKLLQHLSPTFPSCDVASAAKSCHGVSPPQRFSY